MWRKEGREERKKINEEGEKNKGSYIEEEGRMTRQEDKGDEGGGR